MLFVDENFLTPEIQTSHLLVLPLSSFNQNSDPPIQSSYTLINTFTSQMSTETNYIESYMSFFGFHLYSEYTFVIREP